MRGSHPPAAQSTEILTRSCLGLMESRAAAASEEERPGKAAARASSGLCPSGSSHLQKWWCCS